MNTEEGVICTGCRSPKTQYACDLCSDPLCKKCVEFLDDQTFAFWANEPGKLPEELKHSRYCTACRAQHVAPALEKYEETMAKAREVFFFFKTHVHPPYPKQKAKQPIHVKACVDRDETILRLGFKAIEMGFNALLQGEVACHKIRNEGWQKMGWEGSGLPVLVDADELNRRGDPEDY